MFYPVTGAVQLAFLYLLLESIAPIVSHSLQISSYDTMDHGQKWVQLRIDEYCSRSKLKFSGHNRASLMKCRLDHIWWLLYFTFKVCQCLRESVSINPSTGNGNPLFWNEIKSCAFSRNHEERDAAHSSIMDAPSRMWGMSVQLNRQLGQRCVSTYGPWLDPFFYSSYPTWIVV